MCSRCDGYSEEEVERALDLQIRVNGWTATQISDDGDLDPQVLPPPHLFCACHAEQRRRLDTPPDRAAPESA